MTPLHGSLTGPIPLPRQYPAHLQLCYRGVKYRPAALQLFVARGGWGPILTITTGASPARQSLAISGTATTTGRTAISTQMLAGQGSSNLETFRTSVEVRSLT